MKSAGYIRPPCLFPLEATRLVQSKVAYSMPLLLAVVIARRLLLPVRRVCECISQKARGATFALELNSPYSIGFKDFKFQCANLWSHRPRQGGSPNLNEFETGQETIFTWNGPHNLGTGVQNETLEISQGFPFGRQGAR